MAGGVYGFLHPAAVLNKINIYFIPFIFYVHFQNDGCVRVPRTVQSAQLEVEDIKPSITPFLVQGTVGMSEFGNEIKLSATWS